MVTVKLAREAMATRFEIVLHGDHAARLRAAGEEALAEISRLEDRLSLYRPSSEIAQLNTRASHESVRVSPETFALLEHCARLSRETRGAFDITIAPLVRCWGIMNASGRIPSADEISKAQSTVGMEKVQLNAADCSVRFAEPGVMLDLGAIGKGFAVQRGVKMLRESGVTSALIHGGTSTAYALGHPPGAKAWSLALPTQVTDFTGKPPPVIELCDAAVSVSAVWGRSFTVQGKTIGHVIDSRRGEPVDHTVMSAVVLPDATETDALSTALLVMGTAGLKAIQELRPLMRSYVLARNGNLATLPLRD